ncbi:MAG TPA: hypothetical protein PLB92_06185 [Rhodoglobus sp.]|nr:hypothetical protein [Rhodoglobus sp.]
MAKIESLTPEQWAEVHQHRDQVIERCLNQPLDHNKIGQSIGACYEAVGEKPPLAIVWAPGPVAALAWSAILRAEGEKPEARQLGDQLWGQLRGQLRGQLGDQLRGQLGGQLGDQLGGQLWDQLRDQLWDQLWDQLGDQLGDQLRDQLWDQLQNQLQNQLRGQLQGQLGGQLNGAIASGWWLTDYEFWLHIAQISGITPPDEATLSLARQAADMLTPTMIIPLRGVCIAVDQHTALHRDNRNRLHCTDGAAWAWADGTQIYALDGIRVPEWVVRRPDPKRIISDELPNTEQRRVAMAHYGWDRAVDDLNLKIIEASDNPVWGTLYALPETLVERGQATLLVCQNASPDRDGTVRTYGLLASSEARTVVAAQASLAQLSESEWLTLEGAS